MTRENRMMIKIYLIDHKASEKLLNLTKISIDSEEATMDLTIIVFSEIKMEALSWALDYFQLCLRLTLHGMTFSEPIDLAQTMQQIKDQTQVITRMQTSHSSKSSCLSLHSSCF